MYFLDFPASVDISDFIYTIFLTFFNVLYDVTLQLDTIIVFKGSKWGLDAFNVSLLDFNIGLVVVSIVVGAFVHVNKADNFYSNRKD